MTNDLRRYGSALREGYKPTHGKLFGGPAPTRHCWGCNTHKPIQTQGWHVKKLGTTQLWYCQTCANEKGLKKK